MKTLTSFIESVSGPRPLANVSGLCCNVGRGRDVTVEARRRGGALVPYQQHSGWYAGGPVTRMLRVLARARFKLELDRDSGSKEA